MPPDDLQRATALREAARLVEEFAPTTDVRHIRDRTDILRRLGLIAANLERRDTASICRRCHAVFHYRAAWYEQRALSIPRHCDICRAIRKQERGRAGFASNPALESPDVSHR